MIGTETISRVIGQDVYDESGSKIGSAAEVYLDDETGQPEWVTVRTGLFGTKESFVPIRDADLTDDGLRVPVSKDRVKDAPKIDADGHLSPQEEQDLYHYYGMDFGPVGTMTGDRVDDRMTDERMRAERIADDRRTDRMMGGPGNDTATAGLAPTGMAAIGHAGGVTGGDVRDADMRDADMDADVRDADMRGRHAGGRRTVGHDTSGPETDDAMTRSEERMNVGTRREETGRARLRKYVVTENVTETVPVSREEVRVEREPITDANVGRAMEGPAISEEEHEVTLHAERPVVEKEAVPVERVRMDTETVSDREQVSADLRKEEIDVDGARDAGTGRDRRDERSFTQKAKDALDRDGDGRMG